MRSFNARTAYIVTKVEVNGRRIQFAKKRNLQIGTVLVQKSAWTETVNKVNANQPSPSIVLPVLSVVLVMAVPMAGVRMVFAGIFFEMTQSAPWMFNASSNVVAMVYAVPS